VGEAPDLERGSGEGGGGGRAKVRRRRRRVEREGMGEERLGFLDGGGGCGLYTKMVDRVGRWGKWAAKENGPPTRCFTESPINGSRRRIYLFF
jgi:hypothetical protein